jgi:hypothetical protein
MGIMTYTGTLVITSCWCGIQLAIPNDLHDFANRHGSEVYCPLGHKFVYGDGENKRLKQELESKERALKWEREYAESVRQERDRTERKLRATKGVLTKTRKRIANGVCPCCQRHFANVERHIKNQHPDFAEPTDAH